MNDDSAMVIFQPSGRRGRVLKGTSVLEAARLLGVGIEALCGGHQVCGKCKVIIESGRFEKYNITSSRENAGPWMPSEEEHITADEQEAGYRLGCVAEVRGDLLVYVPEESRPGKQVVSKAARPIAVDRDPAVRTYAVLLEPSSLEDPTADYERLTRALAEQYGLSDLTIDVCALRSLSGALRTGQWEVTVSVWMDREIIRVRTGKGGTSYGMAIDIGTTTLAGYLCDLNTQEVVETVPLMNPQVQFGEDVIARINYALNYDDGLQRMSQTIVEGLNLVIDRALAGAFESSRLHISRDDIEDVVICGNTTMQHLLMQFDPEPLGTYPFTPTNHCGLDVKARDIGIRVNPSAYIYVLPNVAGFVGGDNVGVILAEEPHRSEDTVLIIDIGTNGELVIGNRKRMVCSTCSCATGPALEGAQIEFGMRAAPGAIERIKIDPATLDVDYKVVGRDTWRSYSAAEQMQTKGICGSAVVDAVAELFKAGIITQSGAFNAKAATNHLRENPDTGMKEFVLAPADETSIGRDVVITQNDIRQVQLAKAAIYTGCKLMLQRLNLERPDRIKIAGAFGNHMDRASALCIGLFPDCELSAVTSVGNAAGDGCRAALLDRKKRIEADWVAHHVEYIELTLTAEFPPNLL
jgi:uncharacterized 2Fe-2S/4Fe-4S cluster protein (DUF4445 family)